ncbi:hypothetical protein [Armatimonas sp.]|uniref:hypothetical protein n=1 Tax=Armatimonas sp. TaxID=1872638 RepID=UPI00286B456C|nr:hypothetical protein [Armatimonas sp.]
MQNYLAYYWMKQGERGSNLCETLSASSYEDALHQVEGRLTRQFFSFISENKGRVLVISAHVQFVEVEGIDNDLPFDNPELPGV